MNQSPVSGFVESEKESIRKEAEREREKDNIQKQILETLSTISCQLDEILDTLKNK